MADLGIPRIPGAPARGGAGRYRDLARLIRDQGLLNRHPTQFFVSALTLLGALGIVIAVMVSNRDSWWLLLLAPAMAIIATQTSFLGHDIGHLQVTRSATMSRALGLVAGDLLSGLSYGWWVQKHNAHHAHPNDLESDPDVRAGALIWDVSQGGARRGAAAWWTRHQAEFFFPLLLLEALNLHLASVRALVTPGLRLRVPELLLLGSHFLGYSLLLLLTMTWQQALIFFMIHKGIQGLYLGCSFAPSHKGMPIMDAAQARDPLLRQVLTSRNVRGGRIACAIYGGLNYQIEHHLFPSMPRRNLRRAQPLVRAFCLENQIPYAESSALECYAAAIKHMHSVGSSARG